MDSRKKREFDDEDVAFMQEYANILGAAIERHRFQDALAEALASQKRLFAELQHRVANNFAILASMLRLKTARTDDPVVAMQLKETLGQLQTLASLHDKLHAASGGADVNLATYLPSLCNDLASFSSDESVRLEIRSKVEPALVAAEIALPLGIVANEFVTNSFKHATVDGVCAIDLSVALADDALLVTLHDHGPGRERAAVKAHDLRGGSGIGLMEGMLAQIDAEWAWRDDGGVGLEIRLPRVAAKASFRRE